jgi:hypothetical protein
MTDMVRVEIDGDLWLCILQDDEKAGSVKILLNDHQNKDNPVVLPREWCTEWVGGEYAGLYVTGVRGQALAILLEYAGEWSYLFRDANKGEFGNETHE